MYIRVEIRVIHVMYIRVEIQYVVHMHVCTCYLLKVSLH